MSSFDRKTHLKQVHEARRANTQDKVNQAIHTLVRLGKSVNFNSVANESGISKATLYKIAEIKERIIFLREQESKIPTRGQVKRKQQDDTKDAIIESLKRKIRKLEEDNRRLNEQLKRAYDGLYNKL